MNAEGARSLEERQKKLLADIKDARRFLRLPFVGYACG